MEKLASDIILAPVLSEKTMIDMAENKKYTFKVRKDANKVEIRKAAESLFGVKVSKVNTLHVRGALRRMGNKQGYRPNWKKATITLTEDSKTIEFFDSMM